MRKVLITLAAAASALAVASPAAAQYYPQPQYGTPGYGQPGYGQQGYGYNNHYGYARQLQVRVDRIQREITRLAQYRIISRNEITTASRTPARSSGGFAARLATAAA